MYALTVQVTHRVKAGNLDLEVSDTTKFFFETDDEATVFAEEVKSDPACKITGFEYLAVGSVNSARAKLYLFKESVANSF